MKNNNLPKYSYPIPEENRIKKLFKEYEIKKLGIKKLLTLYNITTFKTKQRNTRIN